LFNGDRFTLQRLFHQAFRLIAHRLFRHFCLLLSAPVVLWAPRRTP
jgi:hypothetical protein